MLTYLDQELFILFSGTKLITELENHAMISLVICLTYDFLYMCRNHSFDSLVIKHAFMFETPVGTVGKNEYECTVPTQY